MKKKKSGGLRVGWRWALYRFWERGLWEGAQVRLVKTGEGTYGWTIHLSNDGLDPALTRTQKRQVGPLRKRM